MMDPPSIDKCRICLKNRRNVRFLSDAEDGITFLDMITFISNPKIFSENNIPDKICLPCRKRLKEAYSFKMDIERSEMILNETANRKKICFNNIRDVKIQFEIECKPILPNETLPNHLFQDDMKTVTYNDTVIKKIKQEQYNSVQKTQISVKEFLNSVKMDSDDNCDDRDYELDEEYGPPDSGRDSDYNYGKPLTSKKVKKTKNNAKGTKSKDVVIQKPIKPVLLKDVKIIRRPYEDPTIPKIKKKYKAPYRPAKKTICPYCGKILLEHSLKYHILIHTGEKTFKCVQCPATFYTESVLQKHMTKHSETNKFKCDKCLATFTTKEGSRDHMLVHIDEKKQICDVCNKGFKRKHALKRHMLRHTFGKKPVQCELCPMTFFEKAFLQHHMRIHTGERPYRCDLCSQPYSYKHDFNRHCLKKHSVFLKRRSINIMNEEVLQTERALMKDLALRAHGVLPIDDIPRVFEGPQGHLAYELAIKAILAKQVPISIDTTYML